MASFPQVNDFPLVLQTSGWEWQPYNMSGPCSKKFWVGTDCDGCNWLTKLKGSFYGYREIVFARLAQRMGWSCQTSVFALLDDNALDKMEVSEDCRTQAVHLFMDEHSFERCTLNCPFRQLKNEKLISIENLKDLALLSLLDWPKSDYAACLFGAGEPSDILLTSNHELMIIDSEQMFASGPGSLSGTMWCENLDGSPSKSAQELKIEVCRNVASLSDEDLIESLRIPNGLKVDELWSISSNIKKSHEYAQDLLLKE